MTKEQLRKYTPPLRCILRRAIVGVSPTATMTRCKMGLRHECSKCKNCNANLRVPDFIYKTRKKEADR